MSEKTMTVEEIRKEIERLEQEMTNAQKVSEPIDVEAHVVEEPDKAEPVDDETPQINLVTLLQIGLTTEGNFIFDVQGDRNIVIIEGLRRYFNERIKLEWERIVTPDLIQPEPTE